MSTNDYRSQLTLELHQINFTADAHSYKGTRYMPLNFVWLLSCSYKWEFNQITNNNRFQVKLESDQINFTANGSVIQRDAVHAPKLCPTTLVFVSFHLKIQNRRGATLNNYSNTIMHRHSFTETPFHVMKWDAEQTYT